MNCKYCGADMDYVGVDDGGGDYGSAVCDQWTCPECDWAEESNCIEIIDDLEDMELEEDHEL